MNFLKKWIVLCWNIRGLNDKSKQLALMNAINVSGCSVVGLQETKKCDFDIKFIPSLDDLMIFCLFLPLGLLVV
jgi:hypothetical protein